MRKKGTRVDPQTTTLNCPPAPPPLSSARSAPVRDLSDELLAILVVWVTRQVIVALGAGAHGEGAGVTQRRLVSQRPCSGLANMT